MFVLIEERRWRVERTVLEVNRTGTRAGLDFDARRLTTPRQELETTLCDVFAVADNLKVIEKTMESTEVRF